LVFQERGGRKFTDLDKVKPQVVGEMEDEDGAFLVLNFPIAFSKGLLYKSLLFGIEQPLIKIHYHFKWDGLSVGAYRIGIVTLNSEAFVRDQLRILVKNGGNRTETFNLTGYEIDHTKAVNFDISANQCLGASDGVLILKDNNKGIKISVPKKICYSVPLLTFREFFNHEKVTDYFCRISHSIGEMDDTAAYLFKGESSFHFKIQGIN